MDLFSLLHDNPGSPQILMGSVGWDDEEEHAFLGDEDENDGHTLVRVQLFEGRDNTKPLNPTRAQGHKLICHLSGMLGTRIPPKDTRVFVAVPSGMENVPGAGVIFATIEKLPRKAGNVKTDEVIVPGPNGSEGRVALKENGTVSMVTSVNNERGAGTVVLTIGPDGFKFSSPYGSMVLDVTGFHVKTKAGPRIDMGGITITGIPANIPITGYCNITAPLVNVKGSIVQLGVGSVFNPVVNCPSASLPVGAPTGGAPLPMSPSVRVAL